MMRSSRSVLLSPPARWTTRRCWSGCGRTVSDPVLTQNTKKADRSGRKQWKICRANGLGKHKSEPKWFRFARVRQPTDQKAGGSNPSRRTKSPRNRLISRTLLFISSFFRVSLFLTQTLTPTGASSGNRQTARDRILPIVCAALSCASVVTWA